MATEPDYLDCSHEASPVVNRPKNKQVWLADELVTDDWKVKITDEALTEIQQLAESIESKVFKTKHPGDSSLPTLPAETNIPHCRQLFTRIKDIIDNGVGFAVADKLPTDDYPADIMSKVFWLLGQLIDQPVSQKHSGQMIYDVRNTGATFGYGVRGSVTNVELNFHTDNAFGRATPDYVGLYCRHPAKEGGVSRFCSLYALHDQIAKSNPLALERLYQPMYYDRQKEHTDNAPPVTWAPYFSWRTDEKGQQRLRTRANASLVRKGYEVAGAQMETQLQEALDTVDEISRQPQFWFEAALEKGQVQYLNNQETGHYRSEFIDFEETEKKRHLYRLWHRSEGHWSYDGQVAN